MDNNQNYGQPNYNPQNYNQPYNGMPNNQYYQQPQGQYNNQYVQYQQPKKKKMSAGAIVGIVLGVILLIVLLIGGALFLLGFMVYNSVVSEFDSIGSEIYNTAFDLYIGEDKTANSVFYLMASVKSNNESESETNKITVKIELSDGSTMSYDTYDSERINKDSLYDISANKNSGGYITSIKIVEK